MSALWVTPVLFVGLMALLRAALRLGQFRPPLAMLRVRANDAVGPTEPTSRR